MAAMDYDALAFDLQRSLARRLLKGDNAALIISFFYHQFKRRQRVTITLNDLAERLEDYLEALIIGLNEHYPRPVSLRLFLLIIRYKRPIIIQREVFSRGKSLLHTG